MKRVHINKLALLWSILGLTLPGGAPCNGAVKADAKFFVALNGNDAWSGKLSRPNTQKTDGPFATPQRARDAVRALKTKGLLRSPVTISLRGGTYFLSRPLLLEAQDSGSKEAPIVYRAYPNEKVTLSGGRRISGPWRRQGQIYSTTLPDVQAGTWNFNALFVNNRRATRARTPNAGYFNIVPPAGAGFEPGSDPTYHTFHFRPGDVNPAWSHLDEIEVVSDRRASQSRALISGVEGDLVRLQSYASKPYGWEEFNGGQDRYFLENVREALDSPGEWYLDRHSGVLSYRPLPGEDVGKSDIIAPVLSQLLEIRGDTNRLDLSDAPFTISAWIKTQHTGPQNLVSDWLPDDQYDLTAQNAAALNGYTFGIRDGRFLVGLADYHSPLEQGPCSSPEQPLNDDRWHHLCAIYDRKNKKITGYVDGRRSGALTLSHSFDELETDLPVLLGDFYKRPFKGSIDELFIYNRALSEDEIGALHALKAPTAGLQLAMTFEGDLNDSSRARRSARMNGELSYVPGIKGQALHHPYDARTLVDNGPHSYADFPFAARALVHDITLQGFSFQHTGSLLLPSGYPGYQSTMFLIDKPALTLLGARDVRLENNTIAHVGGHGVLLAQSRGVVLEGNSIFDTAANGIMVAAGGGNVITDNTVHNVGAVYAEGTGIIVSIQNGASSDNRIAHNVVYNTPFIGISIGMTWRTTDFGQNGNITEFNEVHHAMQELNDGGGIYSNGFQRGSVIRNNFVHDIFDAEKTDLFRDAGIYLDNGSKGITVTRNVVLRTGCGLFLNDTHGTTITNNIFADGLSSQAFLFDEGVQLTHNIFFYGAPESKSTLYWPNSGKAVAPQNGGRADFNLYFNRTNPDAGDWRLKSWRDEAGYDRNGRIADPLFVDYKGDNLTLRPNSPALKMGFAPIDLFSVGPRRPADR